MLHPMLLDAYLMGATFVGGVNNILLTSGTPKKGSEMTNGEQSKVLARIVAKCWMDEGFKKNFVNDPLKVLKDEGISVPDDTKIRVIEDTLEQRTIVLPVKPDDLGSVEELEDRLAASAIPMAANSIPL